MTAFAKMWKFRGKGSARKHRARLKRLVRRKNRRMLKADFESAPVARLNERNVI